MIAYCFIKNVLIYFTEFGFMVHSVVFNIILTHPTLFSIIKKSIKCGKYQKIHQYNNILFLRNNIADILNAKYAIISKTTRIIASVNAIILTSNNGLNLTPNDTTDSREKTSLSSAIGRIIFSTNNGIILNDNDKIISSIDGIFLNAIDKICTDINGGIVPAVTSFAIISSINGDLSTTNYKIISSADKEIIAIVLSHITKIIDGNFSKRKEGTIFKRWDEIIVIVSRLVWQPIASIISSVNDTIIFRAIGIALSHLQNYFKNDWWNYLER